MDILVKNMVCRHCVDKVRSIACDTEGLEVEAVELGHIVVKHEPSAQALEALGRRLAENGFEIILSREAEMVENIKLLLIDLSRRESVGHICLASTLESELNASYKTLSRIFTEAEGRTIENYFISLRIERAKELLHYGRMTLEEIAFATGFSSAAHLSRQFKQLTGITPGNFRKMGKRKPLPEV